MQTRLFHLHALSALHCGTGQSAGVVDLPIARARATQLPQVPGSSLRGVLREHTHNNNPEAESALFGPRKISNNEDSFAGALAVGDAQLLLLPVRCLAGISCLITSPFILRHYARDLRRAGIDTPALPTPPDADTALLPDDSVNRLDGKLVLEDSDLNTRSDPATKQWAALIASHIHADDADARADLATRIAVLPDGMMSFLSETATEVRARIAIDPDTGTVKTGALWYEENLPAEAVLWGVYAISDRPQDQRQRNAAPAKPRLPASDTLLQLGGKAGVGRGLVRFLTVEDAE